MDGWAISVWTAQLLLARVGVRAEIQLFLYLLNRVSCTQRGRLFLIFTKMA